MEKLKSILSSATGKRIGPPVPPRPSPAVVAHALSKTRNVSPVNHPVEQAAPQQVPKAHGRTVIYKSPGFIQNLTNTNNGYNKQQQQINVNEENKHFDFKNDSSTSAPTEYQSVVVSESLEFVAGPNQLSNKKIETATVTLNTDDHHFGYTNADGIIFDNCMSNGNRLQEDVNDTVSELNGTGRISPVKTIVSRKSPVARPRSKTPTPAPKVVQVNGSREHSPTTIITSSSILVNGNKPINDNTNIVEISTTKTMNEFIKNNIYYQDMQNNGTNNITNNNKKTISNNTATTKVNGNNNNNSYTNLLSKNQNTSDVQVVNSPSILSSTTTTNTNVPMKKPDLLQIQMKRINQNNELEMANNRKNLINDSGHKLNTNYDKTRSCDNELKEKLFSEMFINSLNRGDNNNGGSGGRVNEANNNYVKYSDIQNKFMKRSTSCDFLNERPDHDEMLHGTINGNLKCKTMDDKLSEKKVAFHEMLISELTEMRKDGKKLNRDESKSIGSLNTRPSYTKSSPDISPNGTRRSRIRNSDVIEVDDTGKQILYSSCFISLEDSGLEDEEKLDDCSSGVGDSWDSCKEVEDR